MGVIGTPRDIARQHFDEQSLGRRGE